MTDQKQYRLLNEGEEVQDGDEYLVSAASGHWIKAISSVRDTVRPTSALPIYRRLIVPAPTLPEARPISQAPYHQRILVWGDGIGWAVFQTGAGPVNEQVYQWWLPMPPAPPEPAPDWELAWKTANIPPFSVKHGEAQWSSESAFRAGWEAAQKGGK